MKREITETARGEMTKRAFRRPVALLLAAVLLVSLLGLCGCGGPKSKFFAVGFVHSNEPSSAFMNFHSFDGTYVFRMKCKDDAARLTYDAKLETGELTVSCVSGGETRALFTLRSGESTQDTGVSLAKGTVLILVETNGRCQNGDLSFSIEG